MLAKSEDFFKLEPRAPELNTAR